MNESLETDGPIVAIGELLWDLLPDGPHLGGAPFNVAVNLRRLGRPTVLVSAVGADAAGHLAISEVKRSGVDATWVQTREGLATGTALTTLDPTGSPTFEIVRPAAFDLLDLDSQSILDISRLSPIAIVMGTLAQQSTTVRSATSRLSEACPSAIRMYDVNLRDGGWDAPLIKSLLQGTAVIKFNEVEAGVLAGTFGLRLDDHPQFMRELAGLTGARAICMTRGANGASLLLDGAFAQGAPPAVDVSDAIGAGDAFAAGLLDGILAGQDAVSILRRSMAMGALVATRAGATPDWMLRDLDLVLASTPVPKASTVFGLAGSAGQDPAGGGGIESVVENSSPRSPDEQAATLPDARLQSRQGVRPSAEFGRRSGEAAEDGPRENC
jgi:fructokinase